MKSIPGHKKKGVLKFTSCSDFEVPMSPYFEYVDLIAVVQFGKVFYLCCLVPRKGHKAIGTLGCIFTGICFPAPRYYRLNMENYYVKITIVKPYLTWCFCLYFLPPDPVIRHVCKYSGDVYVDGETWQVDNCTTCVCEGTRVACTTLKCPEPACEKPTHITGKCCPICLGKVLLSISSQWICVDYYILLYSYT